MTQIVDFVLGANCVGPAYSLSESIIAWLKVNAVWVAAIVIVVLCLVVVVVARIGHRANTMVLKDDVNLEDTEGENGK